MPSKLGLAIGLGLRVGGYRITRQHELERHGAGERKMIVTSLSGFKLARNGWLGTAGPPRASDLGNGAAGLEPRISIAEITLSRTLRVLHGLSPNLLTILLSDFTRNFAYI